ncbi:HD domain-containing phosphohydrolase [Methylogaea oryzae]|nr:HD domain-containing phosphohydrolase [Methylogaea oryzae]
MIAVKLARQMAGFGVPLTRVYDAGLLHDCGVSSSREHHNLLGELEWSGAQQHCDIGYALLKDFPPLANFAPIIRYHHTRWSLLQAGDMEAEQALLANLIYLADRVDVAAAPYYGDGSLFAQRETVLAQMEAHRDSVFAGVLLDALRSASEQTDFWTDLCETQAIEDFQQAMLAHDTEQNLTWSEFRQAAGIMSLIVDAKSPYTYRHSAGVARLSSYLGRLLGLGERHREMIEVAGLLHDIGKLGIPDEILESPKPLSDEQFGQMKHHSLTTHQILRRIGGIDQIADWAAYHHEKMNGQGYPFHLDASHLPLEARIISVADVYQALAQARPYRGPMAPEDILGTLRRLAQQGHLDSEIVETVAAHLPACHQAALREGESGPAAG